jgi:hypothetical protein
MAESGAVHGKHEPGGIHVLAVLAITAGFAVFVAICVAGLYFYYAWAERNIPPPVPHSFPKPVLEQTPLLDLQKLQEKQRAQLQGYAWIDRGKGVARIPIERAMKMVAGRGADAYKPYSAPQPQAAPAGKPEGAAPAQPAPAPQPQAAAPQPKETHP